MTVLFVLFSGYLFQRLYHTPW